MTQNKLIPLALCLSLFPCMSSAFAKAELTKPANSGVSRQEKKGPTLLASRQGEGVDLNVDIGLAPYMLGFENPTFSQRLSIRGDLGFLWIREPAYIGLGVTGGTIPAGISGRAGLGPYVSIAHLWTGLWASMALLVTNEAKVVGSLSVGWSVLGTEAQVSGSGFAIIGKIRIPIGLPVWAVLYDRKHQGKRY